MLDYKLFFSCIALFISIFFLGCSSNDDLADAQNNEKKIEEQNSNNVQSNLTSEKQKLTFEWPQVDYTDPIKKVDIHDDNQIIKAVGKPVVTKENSTNENGEPQIDYWFSESLAHGLHLSLSREFVNVDWQFDQNKPEQAINDFNDGQRITRALLGGKVGGELYEKISKGLEFKEINLEDGLIIENARCGNFVCRYTIVRD